MPNCIVIGNIRSGKIVGYKAHDTKRKLVHFRTTNGRHRFFYWSSKNGFCHEVLQQLDKIIWKKAHTYSVNALDRMSMVEELHQIGLIEAWLCCVRSQPSAGYLIKSVIGRLQESFSCFLKANPHLLNYSNETSLSFGITDRERAEDEAILGSIVYQSKFFSDPECDNDETNLKEMRHYLRSVINSLPITVKNFMVGQWLTDGENKNNQPRYWYDEEKQALDLIRSKMKPYLWSNSLPVRFTPKPKKIHNQLLGYIGNTNNSGPWGMREEKHIYEAPQRPTWARSILKEYNACRLLEWRRWGHIPNCPKCKNINCYQLKDKDGYRNLKMRWVCQSCHEYFTVRTGTIMENSKIKLSDWCLIFLASKEGTRPLTQSKVQNLIGVSNTAAHWVSVRLRHFKKD